MKVFFAIIIATLLLSACCTIKPNYPPPNPEIVSFEPPPVSSLNIPISADFSSKVPELQQMMQSTIDINGGENDCQLSYSYTVRNNSPLDVSFLSTAENPIQLSTQLQVGADATFFAQCASMFLVAGAWFRKIGASCGRGNESLRQVKVSLSSVLGLNPDYTISARTQLNDLYFIDPCRITFLNINISGIIESQARSRIPLGQIDQRIGTISVKDQVQSFWDKINQNIEVDQGLFLKIHPQKLALSKLSGTGQVAALTLGMEGMPEITNDASAPTPVVLPPLEAPTGASGFNIFSDLKLDYSYISSKLTEVLKGNKIDVLGKKITIKKVRAHSTDNRKLILAVYFKGDVCGYVYLTGKPVYDASTGTISLQEVTFDALTSSFLANIGSWLLNPIIERKIEEKATFPIQQFINANIEKINGFLKKTYPNGVTTDGQINGINIVPNNFHALPQFFFIRMHANGELKLAVNL